MPVPHKAALLSAGAAGVKMLAGGKGAAPHKKRRQRRIVFSEKQWAFTMQLIKAVTHGRTPSSKPFRKHRRQKPFF